MPRSPIAVVPIGKTELTVIEDEQGWRLRRWVGGTRRSPQPIEVAPEDRERRFDSPAAAAEWFRTHYGWKVAPDRD